MKTTKIISACAVLVALASCSNDHELFQQSAENTPIRIQANVGGITTRAGSDIQGTQFDEGEIIGIFLKEHLNSEETNVATYSNPITGTVKDNKTDIRLDPTQFFPANGRSVDCLAIYPKDVANNLTSFSVQTDQSTDANYKASDLMYAYTENTPKKTPIQLTFTHLLSKIIVEVVADNSVDESVLNHVYVNLLNTNTTIGITVDDIAQGTQSSAKSVTVGANPSVPTPIKLGHPSYTDGDRTGEVAAIIVPQTITPSNPFIKVRLNNNGGTGEDYATYTYTPTANQIFAGTKSYKYTITIKAGGISVENVQITPWGDGFENVPDGGNGDAILD